MKLLSISIISIALINTVKADVICPKSKYDDKGDTIVAWYKKKDMMYSHDGGATYKRSNGLLYVVALVKNKAILPATNVRVEADQIMQRVNTKDNKHKIEHVFKYDYVSANDEIYCEYAGAIHLNEKSENIIFSSNSNVEFRNANESEIKEFKKFSFKGCANNSGLLKSEKQATCKEADLISVTDINSNGKPEFWATEIYKWYIGITVWEHDGEKYKKIIEACPECG